MEFLAYSASLIFSFLGILAGLLLSAMAFEEIEHVRKFLKYLDIILIGAIIFFTLWIYNTTYAAIISLLAIILLNVLYERYFGIVVYTIVGVIFTVAMFGPYALEVAILAAILGMSIGTAYASKAWKNKINTSIELDDILRATRITFGKYFYYLISAFATFIVMQYLI